MLKGSGYFKDAAPAAHIMASCYSCVVACVLEWQRRTAKRCVGQIDDIKRVAGAAGYKCPRIVEFRTPNNRPMSSSGRQSVDLMAHGPQVSPYSEKGELSHRPTPPATP
ncbi:jg1745 [Pararge aegeria aegeria]|uniref:Jg1745 protein n=1 Tax=Pararge aegeria aegeria TaxID=348720 RepID=A0A8S4SPT8_9NEOP|nr:jg1745 [Pararge aegeria aegeria]